MRWKFWRRDPVYSELGVELFRLLNEGHEKWTSLSPSEITHCELRDLRVELLIPSTPVSKKYVMVTYGDQWADAALTEDDHSRLFGRVLSIRAEHMRRTTDALHERRVKRGEELIEAIRRFFPKGDPEPSR